MCAGREWGYCEMRRVSHGRKQVSRVFFSPRSVGAVALGRGESGKSDASGQPRAKKARCSVTTPAILNEVARSCDKLKGECLMAKNLRGGGIKGERRAGHIPASFEANIQTRPQRDRSGKSVEREHRDGNEEETEGKRGGL